MRRHLAYFALSAFAVALLSCIKEYGIENPNPETDPASYVVTVDDAMADVEGLLAELDPQTRGGSPRTISETIVRGGFGATRSADGPEEPLYYIFNFANNEGFAVASGDSRTPPVFCITDSGNFDASAIAKNRGAAMILVSYDTDYRVTVRLPVYGGGDGDGGGSDSGWINPGKPGYPDGTGWGQMVTGRVDGGNGKTITYEIGPWTKPSITWMH